MLERIIKEILLGFMSVMCARGVIYLIKYPFPLIMNRVLFGYSMAIISIIFYVWLKGYIIQKSTTKTKVSWHNYRKHYVQ